MVELEGIDVEAMAAYLEETDVVYAVVFGSHARGEAESGSDVDVALRFPDDATPRERFDRRNRIDAHLQSCADPFVDVSDLAELPTSVARRALREGVLVVGDEADRQADRRRVENEYEATRADREAERRAFLDDLAEGRS